MKVFIAHIHVFLYMNSILRNVLIRRSAIGKSVPQIYLKEEFVDQTVDGHQDRIPY